MLFRIGSAGPTRIYAPYRDLNDGMSVPDIAVVILNGASSSGTSTIARALQRQLPRPCLVTGVDHLVEMMPAWMMGHPDRLLFADDGSIAVGAGFRRLEAAWRCGVAAMARRDAPVIVDEVLLGGAAGQAAWRDALGDLPVLWVGVQCALPELLTRERRRGDRVTGQAETQAAIVHRGMAYDLIIDTTTASPDECAARIVGHVTSVRPSPARSSGDRAPGR